MHCFPGKGCSEFPKSMHYCVGILNSVVRYREGDFNETVFIKGDGYSTPATPEEIISLSKRKYGVDNETSEILYEEKNWKEYLDYAKNIGKAYQFRLLRICRMRK